MSPFTTALAEVCDRLNREGARYLVVGARALQLWGSTRATRDIDILAEWAADGLCSVAISVTTLDAQLKRLLEPRAASGPARLAAMEALAGAGIPVTLLFAPVIPALTASAL